MTSALRQRVLALLWSGHTVSVAGDGIFTVAVAVQTLRIDSHPLALATVLAARLAPTVLLLLLSGVVVDRVHGAWRCWPRMSCAARRWRRSPCWRPNALWDWRA